jgi:hypothetical protein
LRSLNRKMDMEETGKQSSEHAAENVGVKGGEKDIDRQKFRYVL